jgi:putative PIN family toxin of toxin-antitoxin system
VLRVVLVTDVVVAGFLSPDGASRQLLLDALDVKFTLLASTTLLLEYESVLRRKEHQEKAQTTDAGLTDILDGLADVCRPVVFDFSWRPTGAHADYELVISTAINGNADALVTFNLRDMRLAGNRFGFEVERPREFLSRLRRRET